MAIKLSSATPPTLQLGLRLTAPAGCNYCEATFPDEDLETDEGIASALIAFIGHARLKHLEVLQDMLGDPDCPHFVRWLIERELVRA